MACGVCPGALSHLGVMLLWCLQKRSLRGCARLEAVRREEAVRSTASTAAAAEPKAVEKKLRRWKKTILGWWNGAMRGGRVAVW